MKESVENRLLCCNVRKVQPLTQHLDGLDAWVTGLRRDQWATRTNIRKVEIDHDHGAIVKLNPLAEWTKREVWAYLRENDVPVHALYAKGYTSIGCEPCTRRSATARTTAPGAGGGRATRRRSAACTARSSTAASSTSSRRSSARSTVIAVRGDAAEVALGEAQAVLAARARPGAPRPSRRPDRRGAGRRARRRRGAGARGADRARAADRADPLACTAPRASRRR